MSFDGAWGQAISRNRNIRKLLCGDGTVAPMKTLISISVAISLVLLTALLWMELQLNPEISSATRP